MKAVFVLVIFTLFLSTSNSNALPKDVAAHAKNASDRATEGMKKRVQQADKQGDEDYAKMLRLFGEANEPLDKNLLFSLANKKLNDCYASESDYGGLKKERLVKRPHFIFKSHKGDELIGMESYVDFTSDYNYFAEFYKNNIDEVFQRRLWTSTISPLGMSKDKKTFLINHTPEKGKPWTVALRVKRVKTGNSEKLYLIYVHGSLDNWPYGGVVGYCLLPSDLKITEEGVKELPVYSEPKKKVKYVCTRDCNYRAHNSTVSPTRTMRTESDTSIKDAKSKMGNCDRTGAANESIIYNRPVPIYLHSQGEIECFIE